MEESEPKWRHNLNMNSKSHVSVIPEAVHDFLWHYLTLGMYDLAGIILSEHSTSGHQRAKMLTGNKRKCQLCFLLLVEDGRISELM